MTPPAGFVSWRERVVVTVLSATAGIVFGSILAQILRTVAR